MYEGVDTVVLYDQLAYHDVLPVQWLRLPSPPDRFELIGIEEANLVLLHACSVYPAYYPELNLKAITTLRERYGVPVGYSGHETGLPSTIAAVALGACCVERHITLDRAMWGSDQAASLEPNGISKIVTYVRIVVQLLGDGVKRVVEREQPIIKKLRRVGAAA